MTESGDLLQIFKSFGFGSATASYQVEGAWNEDGKGENIWDWWSHMKPEETGTGRCKISNCETGDIACDSYHNIDRDVQSAKDLNLQQYRFSLSWARILPTGYGSCDKITHDFRIENESPRENP